MSDTPNEDKAETARRARERIIERLKLCTCLYPTVRYRNGSGHNEGCPAHKHWKECNLR